MTPDRHVFASDADKAKELGAPAVPLFGVACIARHPQGLRRRAKARADPVLIARLLPWRDEMLAGERKPVAIASVTAAVSSSASPAARSRYTPMSWQPARTIHHSSPGRLMRSIAEGPAALHASVRTASGT